MFRATALRTRRLLVTPAARSFHASTSSSVQDEIIRVLSERTMKRGLEGPVERLMDRVGTRVGRLFILLNLCIFCRGDIYSTPHLPHRMLFRISLTIYWTFVFSADVAIFSLLLTIKCNTRVIYYSFVTGTRAARLNLLPESLWYRRPSQVSRFDTMAVAETHGCLAERRRLQGT